ncbi:MAG: hypothetical protein QM661_03945 [Solimonas sp.]
MVGTACGPGPDVMRFNQHGIPTTMISHTQPISAKKSRMNMSFRHVDHAQGRPELRASKKIIAHMIDALEGEESAGYASVDFIVRNNKQYRPNPLLRDGDGPVPQFRELAAVVPDRGQCRTRHRDRAADLSCRRNSGSGETVIASVAKQ